MLGLCLVKISARLVEVRPSYGPKTAKNWRKNVIFSCGEADNSGGDKFSSSSLPDGSS